jgi:nucleoside-diphosphate-sugar epimerase
MQRASASSQRVLVTGAAGFIGRHCLPLLLERGFEVYAVSSRSVASPDESVHWLQADLLDPGAADRLINETRPTHLLHLAWVTTPGSYRDSPENSCWMEASLELIRRFADGGGRRLVMAGTCLEYGPSAAPCHEQRTPLAPTTPYGQAKLALWQAAQALAARRELSAAWTRIFHLYGPHEAPQRFVPSIVTALIEGRPALCSSGEQRRDFLHVADVAAAHVRLLESDVQGPLNVASGHAVAIKEIAQTIGRIMGRPSLIRLGALPTSASEPPVLAADVTRLTGELDWRPSYDLERGLKHTVDWWRERARLGINKCFEVPPVQLARAGQATSS